MKATELTVTRIGNSRAVCLPAKVLRRCRIGDTVIMEQRSDQIVLRPKPPPNRKLAWEETYRQMAQADEDWTEWEAAPEGLRDLPGDEEE